MRTMYCARRFVNMYLLFLRERQTRLKTPSVLLFLRERQTRLKTPSVKNLENKMKTRITKSSRMTELLIGAWTAGLFKCTQGQEENRTSEKYCKYVQTPLQA